MTSLRSGVKLTEMIKCIKHRIKNIFSIFDKAGRLDYFCVSLGLLGFIFIPLLFPRNYQQDFYPWFLVIGIILVFANTCRRLNDLNQKLWNVIWIVPPIIGQLYIIYLIFAPGKKVKKRSGRK